MNELRKNPAYHLLDLDGVTLPVAPMQEHRAASINKDLVEKLINGQQGKYFGPILESQPAQAVPTHGLPSRMHGPAALGLDYSLPSAASTHTASLGAGATPAASEAPSTYQENATQATEPAQQEPQAALDEAPAAQTAAPAEAATEEQPSATAEQPETAQAEPETPAPNALSTTAEQDTPMATMQPENTAENDKPQATEAGTDTEHMLFDVQSTLDNLAGMARGLAQQKLEADKHRDSLESRQLQVQERERLLQEKEEQFRLKENQLQRDRVTVDQQAENNSRLLAERSAALQQLAESIETRERASVKRAESLQQEQQRTDELAEQLRQRLTEIEKRDAALQKRNLELNDKFKQLVSAKERFSAIVKSFNETVQFNNGLHAISMTALGEDD
ncbi:hypothetical protein P3W75_04930 [Pseudomonas citronellolis]|nr:hypothetical protein [Pseudomonas citronellolis]MDF3931956.1 hypothetical protein [Pseudomonas citronellolis]